MPIRPENRKRYPSNWKSISDDIRRVRARNRCEGSPAYPDCGAVNGMPHPVTGSLVVLTVAHLDHQPENCDPENLKAWCQRCHNTYDAEHRRQTRRKDRAVGDLFEKKKDGAKSIRSHDMKT
jgi:5-methylcytosine-specific restriction endonuclease McrA